MSEQTENELDILLLTSHYESAIYREQSAFENFVELAKEELKDSTVWREIEHRVRVHFNTIDKNENSAKEATQFLKDICTTYHNLPITGLIQIEGSKSM